VPASAASGSGPLPAQPDAAPAASGTPVQVALVALGVVAFLYLARPVVLPVFLACMAGMTLKPLIRWLSYFITPMLLGRRFTLNPVVIFVFLIFWTWLWGVPGALLSVPILVSIKVVCDRIPSMSQVSELITSESNSIFENLKLLRLRKPGEP